MTGGILLSNITWLLTFYEIKDSAIVVGSYRIQEKRHNSKIPCDGIAIISSANEVHLGNVVGSDQ